MDTSIEPVVVMQTNHDGYGRIVGLAYEKDPIRNVAELLPSTRSNSASAAVRYLSTDYSTEESSSSSTSRASILWRDLAKRVRRSRRLFGTEGCLIASVFPRNMTLHRLVPFLSEDERPEIQEQAAKALAAVSTVKENQLKIADSLEAMAGLSRLLFTNNPSAKFHAAVALGNVAALEENSKSFTKFPETLSGLVNCLFDHHNVLAQQGAAMALANLSLSQNGSKMILDTPLSIPGLVELALTMQTGSMGCPGQEEGKRALVNLALSRENRRILEFPVALVALAGLLRIEDTDDSCTSPLMQEKAIRALASLSYTKQNAQKIAQSGEFPLILEVLVRLIMKSSMIVSMDLGRTSGRLSGNNLAVRKMAVTVLANLSITEQIQRTVADFPDALAGLFLSLQLEDGDSSASLQLHECAAMALGNLALSKVNRRKILECGSHGLAGLASVLFQDENPGGQESAAWALANLSHDAYASEDTTNPAVQIAETPNVISGLARLLRLPTAAHHDSGSRIRVQEQAVRALANLSYPHINQVTMARVPNVVKTLAAALLSRHCCPNSSPMIQEHAARAFANLTCAKENWKSAKVFGDSIGALTDLLSSDNFKASPKMRDYGAIAMGNFALARSHHRRIVDSQHAMSGLVGMLGCDNPGAKEKAAWVLANLAHGDNSTKTAIASFPLAVRSLRGLLSKREGPRVQAQATRALAGLEDALINRLSSTSPESQTVL